MGEYSIGVDIGGTNLRAAAVASDGVMLDKLSGTTDLHEGREAVIQDIIDSIHRLKEKRGADTLAGVGIGVPGFILMEEGKIIGSNNLPEFENYPMRDDIGRKLGTPIFLENDANAAGYAEFRFGGARDVVTRGMVTIGPGGGGGAVVEG